MGYLPYQLMIARFQPSTVVPVLWIKPWETPQLMLAKTVCRGEPFAKEFIINPGLARVDDELSRRPGRDFRWFFVTEAGGGLELNSAKWVECLIGVGVGGGLVSYDLALLKYIFTVYLHRDQHKIDILERERERDKR